METPTPDPLSGRTLHGRYVLGTRVRSGASGTVYAAQDLREERAVAVTVLHPWLMGNHGAVHAFLGRAQTLEAVAHPGLARVLAHGRDEAYVYAVAEYLRGETLAEVLGDGETLRYSPHMALSIVADVLAALDTAHRLGVVHGEIAPDKVVMDDGGRARVTGFPLLFDAAEDAGPDSRTDVRDVGVLLHRLMTGDSAVADEGRPLRPSAALPDLPPDLDMLVANATDPNPRYRPRDAGQYLTLVEQVMRSLPRTDRDREGDTRPIPVVADLPVESAAGAAGDGRSGAVPRWRRPPVLVAAGVLVLALFAAGWALVPAGGAALPDVLGSDPEAAEARLAELDLELVVAFDETYSDTEAVGSVADTTPEAGAELERGDEVMLWLSAGPQFAEVPDVVGGTENAARDALRTAGFTHIEVFQEHSAEEAPGTVLSTVPATGEEGDRAEAVTVHVSEGVIVPTLLGMGREEAGEALTGLGLVFEVAEAHHGTAPEGEVAGQTPEPGTILPEEGVVTLTVSLGPEPEDEETEEDGVGEPGEGSPSDDGGGRGEGGRGDGGRGDGGDGGDRGDDGWGNSGAASCAVAAWDGDIVYDTGDQVNYRGRVYEARWWIQGVPPTMGEEWGVWEDRGSC
ncbi:MULTISPECIES: PASTA domain-containing protein [Nocardiopsidaceae]|uniref:non-specific serine/threonine protein kinase n=1 Tax=Streptomonospora nanhaiensis TaxID=1323731 RepID=A0ABY6YMT1_9ACTN|nr:PASTA domain-containing protein [Streptomonospora nanhaiensis]WAE73613.1 PASTA domain-containing protein [Streptomonospora nanhaiensis]